MKNNLVRYGLQSLVFFILQVVLFRNMALFDLAFCFVYVAIILSIPFETDRIVTIFAAFVLGILVDAFYNSLGIHASALVLLAFLRYYWISAITPQGGYESNLSPTANSMGGQWYSSYALPLIFMHHFALFFVEAGGFSSFGYSFLKVILSTFFTFFVIVIIQTLFFRRKRSI